jgi:DNA-binding NarL/FixJ family response regulator
MPLAEHETNVLRLLAKGHNNSQIAHTLQLSSRTAKQYIEKIKTKTGIKSRVLLAFYALGRGIVTQDEIRAAIKQERAQP